MKKLIPAYILSFVVAVMLYVIEPINTFVNNRNDFNFNFSSLLRPMVIITFVVFLALTIFYTTIYFFNKKRSNKLTFYNITLIASFIGFILIYIIGNYMTSSLPALDGGAIDWSKYWIENLITIVILAILIAVYVICIKKYGYEKVIDTSKYIVLAIFAMVFVSFIPALTNKSLYSNEKIVFVTNNNIDHVSENKNFIIFVVDAVDSRTFANELNKSDYKNMLKDFTYYPDTLSMYIFTRDSIPYMLSGIPNLNETEFVPYYNKAMDNSPFINRLIEEEYQINLYEPDIKWNTEKSNIVQNLDVFDKSFASRCYLKQQTKYNLFKYLPFFLKPFSKINHYNMNTCKFDYIRDAFSFDDGTTYDLMKDMEMKTVKNNQFNFIHVEGAHVPFNFDKDLNRIENGTYTQKVGASIKLVNTYLQKIKESGQYDNSVIIVMADHGFVDGGEGTRANPILYIKGINEHHDMKVADKAVSYADLMDAYNDLLDGKKSTELFSNISNSRERKYIWYLYLEEDHKVEIATKGKAWEYEKEYKTGVEYNR